MFNVLYSNIDNIRSKARLTYQGAIPIIRIGKRRKCYDKAVSHHMGSNLQCPYQELFGIINKLIDVFENGSGDFL